jgi:hypothetical protein
LEEQIQLEANCGAHYGGHDPELRLAVFNAVNGMLTATYARQNRLQNDSFSACWKPTPRQKELPDAAVLRSAILKRMWDGCVFQCEALGVNLDEHRRPRQLDYIYDDEAEDEYDPVVVGYMERVTSVFKEDVRSSHADLDARHAAESLYEQSAVLKYVADDLAAALLHEVTADCLDLDRAVQEEVDGRPYCAAPQSHDVSTQHTATSRDLFDCMPRTGWERACEGMQGTSMHAGDGCADPNTTTIPSLLPRCFDEQRQEPEAAAGVDQASCVAHAPFDAVHADNVNPIPQMCLPGSESAISYSDRVREESCSSEIDVAFSGSANDDLGEKAVRAVGTTADPQITAVQTENAALNEPVDDCTVYELPSPHVASPNAEHVADDGMSASPTAMSSVDEGDWTSKCCHPVCSIDGPCQSFASDSSGFETLAENSKSTFLGQNVLAKVSDVSLVRSVAEPQPEELSVAVHAYDGHERHEHMHASLALDSKLGNCSNAKNDWQIGQDVDRHLELGPCGTLSATEKEDVASPLAHGFACPSDTESNFDASDSPSMIDQHLPAQSSKPGLDSCHESRDNSPSVSNHERVCTLQDLLLNRSSQAYPSDGPFAVGHAASAGRSKSRECAIGGVVVISTDSEGSTGDERESDYDSGPFNLAEIGNTADASTADAVQVWADNPVFAHGEEEEDSEQVWSLGSEHQPGATDEMQSPNENLLHQGLGNEHHGLVAVTGGLEDDDDTDSSASNSNPEAEVNSDSSDSSDDEEAVGECPQDQVWGNRHSGYHLFRL